eukprot:scaffold1123_cov253-Pinguiococcus_pyrenoidosus.AAC.1
MAKGAFLARSEEHRGMTKPFGFQLSGSFLRNTAQYIRAHRGRGTEHDNSKLEDEQKERRTH